MPAIEQGKKAPDFKAASTNGKTVSLKDFKGKRVVLFFYPKDDTPGCTVEACGFRDKHKAIEKLDAVVIGVSPDGIASHQKFIDKFQLSYDLVADESKEACKKYGVWVKKKLYGREYMGVARTTFIISREGVLEKVFEKVKPEGHNDEVIAYLKEND